MSVIDKGETKNRVKTTLSILNYQNILIKLRNIIGTLLPLSIMPCKIK